MSKSIFHRLMTVICDHSSHHWGEWGLMDHQCTETRKCKRCNSYETRNLEHIWGEWKLIDHKCIQMRKCSRCGKCEEKSTDHIWSDWYPNSCAGKKTRDCRHCNAREVILAEHNWGSWKIQDGKCEKVRKCQNCGNLDIFIIPHNWSEWEPRQHDTGNKERKCRQCGKTEIAEMDIANADDIKTLEGTFWFGIVGEIEELYSFLPDKKVTLTYNGHVNGFGTWKHNGRKVQFELKFRNDSKTKYVGEIRNEKNTTNVIIIGETLHTFPDGSTYASTWRVLNVNSEYAKKWDTTKDY